MSDRPRDLDEPRAARIRRAVVGSLLLGTLLWQTAAGALWLASRVGSHGPADRLRALREPPRERIARSLGPRDALYSALLTHAPPDAAAPGQVLLWRSTKEPATRHELLALESRVLTPLTSLLFPTRVRVVTQRRDLAVADTPGPILIAELVDESEAEEPEAPWRSAVQLAEEGPGFRLWRFDRDAPRTPRQPPPSDSDG